MVDPPFQDDSGADDQAQDAAKDGIQRDHHYGGDRHSHEHHNGVVKFFRDTKSELKKVVWPSKADIKTNTVVVLVTVAIAAVVMIALDAIFGGILGLIIGA